MPIALSESIHFMSMYGMRSTIGPLTFDFRSWQIALCLISVVFVMAIAIISTGASNSIPDRVFGSSSSREDDQESQDSGEENGGQHNFLAKGDINSVIHTPGGQWNATGQWGLSVVNGEPSQFKVYMVWKNATSSHTHGFENFQTDDDIVLSSDQSFTTDGSTDISTNGVKTWPGAGLSIILSQGKMIEFTVDHEDTENHFWGQSIYGTVDEIIPCNTRPAAGMEIVTDCT